MKTSDLLDIPNEMYSAGEGEGSGIEVEGGGEWGKGKGVTLQWASVVFRGRSGLMPKKPNLQFVDWKRYDTYLTSCSSNFPAGSSRLAVDCDRVSGFFILLTMGSSTASFLALYQIF